MKSNRDMCVACDDGFLNIRVGAIIMKGGKVLMVGNENVDYLYSVGGRIKFGEMAEEAIVREVFEETGVKMDVDLIFRIAAIGILIAVLNQLLIRSGREEQAMLTTLAGLIVVMTIIIKEISTLFETVKSVFGL